MDFPESNLQPEAQKWRRAVEKTLTELQRRTGALQTNTKTTGARFSSLITQTAAVERQVGETIDDLTEVVEKVERKDQSVWQPKAPVDPVHGQRWFDTTDGNVLRVWIDYGDYARYNFIRNPSFSENTSTWQATGATLTRTVGPDPMARLDVPADVEEPRDVVLIESEGRSHGEWLEGDPDDPDSGPSGFVGTPWAAGADVQVVSGNEDVRAILDIVTDTDVVVSTSGPVEVSASSITRVLATPVEGENILEEVRLRLTVTNLSGGDTVFVDKVMLEATTDTGGDYFDGDMPGVEWVDDPEAGRISQWLGYPDWYELQDEKILREAVDAASDALDEAGQLIDDLRERIGHKRWTGKTYNLTHYRWQPLGGGRVRFTSQYPNNDFYQWTFGGGAEPSSSNKYSVDVRFPSHGTYTVTHYTSGPSGGANISGAVTLTTAMMSEDYGWSDQTFNLEDLTASGGPLDPSVLAEIWEQVVVGGFLVATEAIIGPEAIFDGAVNARHMNVISEVPGGGAFTIDPTSLRIWNLGNNGPNANVVLSAQDGFKIAKDNGTPLLWIDPDTGDLTTSGAVVSGGTISGSSFLGGEIDIRTPTGAPVFRADLSGVSIGGDEPVYERALHTSAEDQFYFTDHVPVSYGNLYRVRFRISVGSAVPDQRHYVDAILFTGGGYENGSVSVLYHYAAPVGSANAEDHEVVVRVHGFNTETMRLQVTKYPAASNITRLTNISVQHIGEGNVSIAGDVTAGGGTFDLLRSTHLNVEEGTFGELILRQGLHSQGGIEANGHLTVSGTANFGDQVDISGSLRTNNIAPRTGSSIQVGSANLYSVTRVGSGAASHFQFFSDYISSEGIRGNSNPNAPNVFINSSGRLYHATSSRRFKDDIQPVPEEYPDRLLQIEAVTFLDKLNLQRHEEVQRKEKAGEEVTPEEYEALEPIRRIPGLIAEDVRDAGLSDYVTYNSQGEVDGYNDRLWTLLIPVVRKQKNKIEELEQRIQALEGESQ